MVYSNDLESHLIHLEEVLNLLHSHKLYVKLSKCTFAQPTVQYLGHTISAQGVAMDASKVQCILDWPQPQSTKALRGFLGLTGYYRRFVKHYGMISKPLNDMLKSGNFIWTPESESAFLELKQAITSAPVLALPNFDEEFFIETDASGLGIGAVLTQRKHPVAFLSKCLSPKNQALSTYEKEMLAVLFAVEKWRPYLLGHQFTILTDHQPLQHMFNQRISTPAQHKWVSKLLGYNYRVQYRAGHLNTVPDILSRRHEFLSIQSFSSPLFDSITLITKACHSDPEALTIITALQKNEQTKKGFSLLDGRLLYKNRIFVPQSTDWRAKILHEFHSTLAAGHSGYLRTLNRLARNFAWPGMRRDVKRFVASCDQCQRNNYETVHPPGLLQPLPVPDNVWVDIAIDFIDGLPLSEGKSSILVVVDRLSKQGHFIAVAHPYTASDIAETFTREVFRLHGMPRSIVSDRDKIFISHFWKHFFKLQGTQLCRSSAYHPQTDGQTEVLNRTLEHYLRCFIQDKPTNWANLLHWAEWWYNSTYHSTIKMTPFQAVYGYPPPAISTYLPGSTAVASVDKQLKDRDSLLTSLKSHMQLAQNRMKQHSDRKRTEREFAEGDWVFLKLHPYRQQSVVRRPSQKLAPRFYGPFQVAAKIGKVAYKLHLPAHTRIHPIFHVSLLKLRIGDQTPVTTTLPQFDTDDALSWEPERVIDMRVVRKKKRSVTEWLVVWAGLPEEDATWEQAHSLMSKFPTFQA